MPQNKARRRGAKRDLEASDTEESYVNGSGGHGSSDRTGAGGVGEVGDDDDNDNDGINNNIGGGRSRQNRGGDSSQHRNKHNFGQWSEAVNTTVQSMGAAHQAIRDLQDMFTSHVDDLRMMEETKNSLRQLEEECVEKDKEIKMKENTITTLTSMKLRAEQRIEHEKTEIEKEKKELEQVKAKQEKRITTTIAEERLKLRSEVEKLVLEQGQSHEKRRTELEDEFAKQREGSNRQAAAIEAENKQLLTTVEQQKKTIAAQAKELEKSIEQCDVLERAKDSVKRDKLALETELEMMKTEFALSPKSKEHFKRRFMGISEMIDSISWKYFSNIDGKDLEKVHKELARADPCFASVPIDDTNDSRSLRVAHAQRIISDAICEYIWKPFRSEFTLLHPDFNDLLAKISDELEKSSQGGRAANAWTALTMRALQSLPTDPIPSQASESKEPPCPTGSSRAEGVVSKVVSILKPLVSPSEHEDLHIDLLKLSKPAIDIWNDAHSGGLKIIVSPRLEPARREEWRSQQFDPPLPSHDYDESKSDIMSNTHPRIFTLFPQVVARELAVPIKHDAGPPGSWPLDSDQRPRTIETCIHPGIGLPEWSPLILRGKEEQEEIDDYISKAVENAKKEIQSGRRTGHGRRESTGSSISSPSSPSQQWKAAGPMKLPEK